MSDARRFSLDSNILVYAADLRSPARQVAAMEIMARAPRRDCVLTPQAVAEFFHAATRKRIVPQGEARGQIARWLTVFPLAAGPDAAILLAAAAAMGRFQFYDALLLATAGAAGCTSVISEDMQHGAQLGSVRVIAAFDAAGGVSEGARALL